MWGDLQEQIRTMQQRVAQLQRQIGGFSSLQSQEIMTAGLQELSTALEQLLVSNTARQQQQLEQQQGDLVYESRATPLPDGKRLVISMARDITDVYDELCLRKQAEETIRRHEQEFRAVVENAPDVIARFDRQLRHLFVNPALEHVTGVPRAAFIGKTNRELGMPEPNILLWEPVIQRIFETGIEDRCEFTYITPNGLRHYQARYVPEFTADGTVESVLEISRDITELKQAEETIRRREQEFRTLADNAPDIIARFDRQLRHVYLNPAAEGMTGIPSQEFIGKTNRELNMPEPNLSNWEQIIQRIFETGSEEVFEFSFVTPIGLRYYQGRYVPEFAADGTVEFVLGICRDISELKQAEEALAESEERFRTSVENMLDCFGIYTSIRNESGQIIDFRTEYLNAAACEHDRVIKEEVIGKGLCELLPNHRESGLFAEYVQVVETEQPLVKEDLIYEDIYGEECLSRAYDIRIVKLNDGFVAVWRDITERQRAEDALRESEQRFRQLAENIREVFWLASPDRSQRIYISSAYEEIWGRTCESWYEKPFSCLEAVHPDDRDRVVAALEKMKLEEHDQKKLGELGERRSWGSQFPERLSDSSREPERSGGEPGFQASPFQGAQAWSEFQQPYSTSPPAPSSSPAPPALFADHEYRIVQPDGTIRWIRDRTFPVRDAQGRIYRIAGIAEDITSRKQVEEEMERALQQERELNELKSNFIAIASHQFRTPLTTISSSADLLERYRDRLSEEKQQSHFSRIQTSVQQMAQLLDDVLLVGKAGAGKLEFNPIPIDVVQFCQDLVEELQLSHKNHPTITFTHHSTCNKAVEGKTDLLPLLDEKYLRHIFDNLLSNAIKYSPDRGTVRFELTCLSDRAVFHIQDEGIGIPPEDLPHLFESFHRARNVGSIQGTGLGLAIVKQCVDSHGGEILVESEVDRGTRLTVILPLNYLH